MKLYEEKDDLLLHAINTIGSEIPMKLFAETQKIELDGGMMTMDGYRRRTPGGVFLFLLKHCTEITKEQKKIIFYDDKKKFEKKRKNSHESKRDQKVEQLKKSLSLTSGDRERKDSLSLLNPESSNPCKNLLQFTFNFKNLALRKNPHFSFQLFPIHHHHRSPMTAPTVPTWNPW